MSFVFTSPQPLFSGLIPPSSLPPYLLDPTSTPPLVKRKPFPAVSSSGTSRLTLTALGVGAGLGGFFVLLAMGLFSLFRKRRKKKQLDELPSKHEPQPQQRPVNGSPKVTKPSSSPNLAVKSQLPPIPSPSVVPIASASCDDDPEDSSSDESVVFSNMTFSDKELAKATNNFSTLLGQGGFGYVHKGVLPDGKEVAVKQLKSGSGQGEREFQAEVDTISSVQHKHLVSLVGYCISGDQRLLVYEYVPNKTLEFHLHGEGRLPLSWSTRLKIALGAARGLVHLHEDCHPKIIHRDIKASNILLDDNFEAKVADFGLAKFSYDSDTHVSTRVMGTFGYLAPEYAASGKLTEKSDVFSFGVVLLELITGRRPIETRGGFSDDYGIVEWAMPLLREALETGNFGGLVDPKLKEYNAAEMAQMVACAAACVQRSARGRPQMSQIVQALEGNLPIENPFNWTSPPSSALSGSSDNEQVKEKNVKKFQKLAFESMGPSSSGFAALASNSDAPLPSISSTEHQSESQDTGSGNSVNDNEDFREIPIL